MTDTNREQDAAIKKPYIDPDLVGAINYLYKDLDLNWGGRNEITERLLQTYKYLWTLKAERDLVIEVQRIVK